MNTPSDMHLHSKKQGMHCNITQATIVKDWARVLRHTTPLIHINHSLIVCPVVNSPVVNCSRLFSGPSLRVSFNLASWGA